MFVDLGVPHVIGFDLKQKMISTFIDNVYTRPKKYDYIYDFCVEFYKNLIQEKTVYQALQESKPRLIEQIRLLNDQIGNTLHNDDVGQGALLFPSNPALQRVKLFDNESFDERLYLNTGRFLDSSRIRGPNNLTRKDAPYTGRQIEMYKFM